MLQLRFDWRRGVLFTFGKTEGISQICSKANNNFYLHGLKKIPRSGDIYIYIRTSS